MQIGKVIKTIREQHGLTQQQLAKFTKLTQGQLSHIERGMYMPQPRNLKKIAKALHTPVQLMLILSIDKTDVPPNLLPYFEKNWSTIIKLSLPVFLDKKQIRSLKKHLARQKKVNQVNNLINQ